MIMPRYPGLKILGLKDEQRAEARRPDIGGPLGPGDQRHLSEELSAAKPHRVGRQVHPHGARSDEVQGIANGPFADDHFPRNG